MKNEKVKVYLYTRVSTLMLIDGYSLDAQKLYINDKEAEAIRIIFDRYVNTDMGSTGIAKYLGNHGVHKIARQNGKNGLYGSAEEDRKP